MLPPSYTSLANKANAESHGSTGSLNGLGSASGYNAEGESGFAGAASRIHDAVVFFPNKVAYHISCFYYSQDTKH
jgi:hypothetical protein